MITKVKGPVPEVEVYVNCPVVPTQIEVPAKLPCGKGLTVIEKEVEVLIQPFPFLTVMFPV